ncbi:MAG TPA: PLP-dependent aminotransferase family protein [Ktedonobacterales bacterium]|nr:PLP-dependent aminotransferase family protein [Ktedonobacterales bacterium]
MLKITVSRESDTPLYRQLTDAVADLIRRGALPAGARLPTVRELAAELGLTRLTIHSAYTELQARGLIESHVGRGTFVAARLLAITTMRHEAPLEPPVRWQAQGVLADLLRLAERSDLLSLAQAMPAPETFPTRAFGRALAAALADPSSMGYGPIQGETALREQVSRVALGRGVAASPDDVLITAGAQQAIELAIGAFTTPGDVMLIEEPTYPGVIEVAARHGLRLAGIRMDADGLDVAALEAACREHAPRLLYTVATFHNPTGVSLAPERRRALLEIARAHHLLILEDDVYGPLGYDGSPPPALKADDTHGHVLYSMSFSKALMPGLRLGALVATPEQLAELAAAKHNIDLVCSPLLQRALAAFLRQGRLDTHLTRVRALYRERRDATLAALDQFHDMWHWTRPAGGLNVWVTLPEGIGERDFCLAALERGIGVAPGRAFYAQPQRRAAFRLSFGAHTPEQLAAAITTLGALLREQMRRRTLLLARASRESAPLV